MKNLGLNFSKQNLIKSMKISRYGTENFIEHEIGIKLEKSLKVLQSKE